MPISYSWLESDTQRPPKKCGKFSKSKSSLVCRKLHIADQRPVFFYSILVEHPTIRSFFVTASLTMTTNLLPLTLSRPSPPLQLSFEEAPVTHNPSSSLPYFLTWQKRIQFVHKLISVDELFWKPKICKQLGRKIYIWTYLCCTLVKRTLSTEKLHSVARWSSYKWPSLIPFPWNRF